MKNMSCIGTVCGLLFIGLLAAGAEVGEAKYEILKTPPATGLSVKSPACEYDAKNNPVPSVRIFPDYQVNSYQVDVGGKDVNVQVSLVMRWKQHPRLGDGKYPSVVRRFFDYAYKLEDNTEITGIAEFPLDLLKMPLNQWVEVKFEMTIPDSTLKGQKIKSAKFIDTRTLDVYHASNAEGSIKEFSFDLSKVSFKIGEKEFVADSACKRPSAWLSSNNSQITKMSAD